MIQTKTSRAWAILFVRLILGLIFLIAGIYKVFDMGPIAHAERMFLPYQTTFLPTWSLWAVGTAIPFVELIGGALVIVGWKSRHACIALGIVLSIIAFGHLLKEPFYSFNTQVIPRLVLVLLVLVVPADWDRYSLDGWLITRL